MAFKLITAPTVKPLTVDEAKVHMRVTQSNEDALITALIAAATEHVENITGRKLITQTWQKLIDAFPETGIELLPPLQSVDFVEYIDINGVEQTINAVDYQEDPYTLSGWVLPAFSKTWPTARNAANAVTVQFKCGYGLAAAVPTPIKQAMLLLIGHWFANRESVNVGSVVTTMPMAVDALLSPYRVVRIN